MSEKLNARSLIYDDAFAIQFQTMKQYREALLKALGQSETDRVYEQYDLGDNELLAIDARKESVCFDLHEIINNDDGWKDGFELTWKEIYQYCKEGFQAEEAEERRKARLRDVGKSCGWDGLLVKL